jgi:hypothetical protein
LGYLEIAPNDAKNPKLGLDFKKYSDYDTNKRLSGLDAQAVAETPSAYLSMKGGAERTSSGLFCRGRVLRD